MTSAAGSVGEADRPVDWPLVRDCVQGDEAAWRLLHLRYYPATSAFLRKLGVADREVDDAAQDVFLELFRYLPRFRGESQLTTWLYRLCITQARQVRRRARISSAISKVLLLSPSTAQPSGPGFSESAARRQIEAALAELPESERIVFVLYEMENVPGKQIAEIVACPEATVWRRLHYARRTCRRALGLDPGEQEET